MIKIRKLRFRENSLRKPWIYSEHRVPRVGTTVESKSI